jgi:hypothetical protein
MDSYQYSQAAGQPLSNNADVGHPSQNGEVFGIDQDVQDIDELIRERRAQKAITPGERAVNTTAQIAGAVGAPLLLQAGAGKALGALGGKALGAVAGKALGAAAGPLGFIAALVAREVGGQFTGGAVGNAIGQGFGHVVGLFKKTKAEKDEAVRRGGEIGKTIVGFKKGGRVKKSGKALVHKKEFIVKSGIKVSKSQKMKVQKRKKTLKAPK